MAAFQYFVPNKTPGDLVEEGKFRAGVLAEHGLAERLKDCLRVKDHFALCEVHGRVGPGGNEGTVIAPVSPHTGLPQPIGSWPKQQIVRPIHRPTGLVAGEMKAVAYILAQKDYLPSNYDLERQKTLFGRVAIDRFGQEWKIPICRSPNPGRLGLPQVYGFDDAGAVTTQVAEEEAWAWNVADEIRNWYLGAQQGKEDLEPFTRVVELVLQVLLLNYRIGKEEIALLASAGQGFLTDDFVSTAAMASFDYDLAVEAKKKPAADETAGAVSSSSATPGDAEGIICTDLRTGL